MAEWKSRQVILGEYTIEKELGRGGMGRVWLVKSQSTGRRFAVKQALIRDEKHRKAFLTELQTWIDLPEHPNIVPCRFFRTVGDEIVIFADFIEGGSLADWIAKGKLTTLDQILDVAIQFAWGLHAIHERGLIHQDVKPGNVLMTIDGVPMVTDFGLARARLRAADGSFVSPALPPGQQSVLVSSGGMTPAYASPEQRNGKPLSRKTDIWSWGVSVLDMFMGGVSCPYGGHIAAEILQEIVASDYEYLSVGALPGAMVEVLNGCFAADAGERWASLDIPAAMLVACFVNVTGSNFRRSEPALTGGMQNDPYVRRDYTGGGWRDPQQWLQVADSIVSGDASSDIVVRRPVRQSRAARAVEDLAQYQEALGKLARVVESGNQTAVPFASALCFDMAHIYGELNDSEGELAAYDRCIRYAELLHDDPEQRDRALKQKASALDQKGLRYRSLGRPDDALACYEESARYWRSLIDSFPDVVSLKSELGITLRNAGIAHRSGGNIREALELYDAAIQLFAEITERDSQSLTGNTEMELQKTLRMKGIALCKLGLDQDALTMYADALAILDSLSAVRNDAEYHTERARLFKDQACAMAPSDALQTCQEAVRIYQELVTSYSSENLLVELAQARSTSCTCFHALGRTQDALAACSASIENWETIVHQMGKSEYAFDYFMMRTTRLMLLSLVGDLITMRSDAKDTGAALLHAVKETCEPRLAQLYQTGQSAGYW